MTSAGVTLEPRYKILTRAVDGASHGIDICLESPLPEAVEVAFERAAQRGIPVRIIKGARTEDYVYSARDPFANENGVFDQVKTSRLMLTHHFCIVDGSRAGPFTWRRAWAWLKRRSLPSVFLACNLDYTLLDSHWDNFVSSKHHTDVERYQRAFDTMWLAIK